MAVPPVPPALQQFVEDEMLRAPLLFDQLVDGALDAIQKSLPTMSSLQRSAMADLMLSLPAQRQRLADYFLRALREQVGNGLERGVPKPVARSRATKPGALALVDEDEVALDVELSHAIEAIKAAAEYELRELQTFVSALVGDMDVSRDHNPFGAEAFARAVWASAQALPLSRGHQVAFMRHATPSLAQLLRRSYAASTSRLESCGIEPAAHRTLILPAGSRRGRPGEMSFVPDLQRMRETMPAPLDAPALSRNEGPLPSSLTPTGGGPGASPAQGALSYQGQAPATPPREHWADVARGTTQREDRQAVELVSRLFDAMQADARVPADVAALIARLRGPAMRLALRDRDLLAQDQHALWQFINRLAFAAEMAPDAADPERLHLLKLAQATIEQLASEPEQNTGLYRWALERLEAYLHKRLTRRLATVSSQIGVLQKLEDKLTGGQGTPSTLHGMLDVPQLDTVPAELLDASAPAPQAEPDADAWLRELKPGTWVRVFLQGHWVQAQMLWPGERREIWLLGDGASDATWAVRAGALRMMHKHGLLKGLRQRSLIAGAAAHVHEQVASEVAA